MLASCVTPLLTATNAAAISSSAASLSGSLDKLCAANGCSNAFIRGRLTDFYSHCAAELADPTNEAVRNMYDILYTVIPLKEVVCTKDADSNAYCVSALSRNATGGGSANAIGLSNLAAVKELAGSTTTPEQYAAGHLSASSLKLVTGLESEPLVKRAPSAVTTDSDGTYPNATTYRLTNLPYLFLQPSDPASLLCSSCAKAVFSAYADWETQTTYALGLSESPILGGQAAIWEAAAKTCGTTWINNIVNAATSSGASAAGNGTAAAGGAKGMGGVGLSGAGRSSVLSGGLVALVGAATAVFLL